MNRRLGIFISLLFVILLTGSAMSGFVAVADEHTPQDKAQTIQTIIQAGDNTEKSYQQVKNWVDSNQSQQYPDLSQEAKSYLDSSEPTEPDTGSSGTKFQTQTQNFTKAEVTDNGNKILGSVTIESRDFNFQKGVVNVQYNASEDVDATYFATEVNRRQQSASITAQGTATFRSDRNSTQIPIPVGSDSTTTINLITDEGAYTSIVSAPPPIIQNLRGALLWTSAGGSVSFLIYYLIRYYLKRAKLLDRYRPKSAYAKGNISGSVQDTVKTAEQGDNPDDGIIQLISTFFTVRRILYLLATVISLLYVLQTFTSIQFGLPAPNDYLISFVGFGVITYTLVCPTFVKFILSKLYNPATEDATVLSEDGKTIASYVGRDGLFEDVYADDIDGKVPIGRNERGDKVYLLSAIDRDNQTAEPAFTWNLSDRGQEMYEEIQDNIPEAVEYVDMGNDEDGRGEIWINEVLDDSSKAMTVVQDMSEMAKEGLHWTKNQPMIRSKIRMEEARDIAEGLSIALSGTPISDVLDSQSDSYRQKEKELENELERERRKAIEGEKAVQDEYDSLNEAGDSDE